MNMLFKCGMILCSLLLINQASACTNIQVKAKDGTLIVSRTMEFGPDMQSRLMNSTRDKKFATTTGDNLPTMQWNAKYGYLFADFFGSGQPVDGMNEKGLSFGYLYLPGYTTYPAGPGDDKTKSLPYTSFGDWILGNFENTQDVENALKDITVFAQPANLGPFHDAVLPVHAVISDKAGSSIVVEFVNGKMVVSKNALGILTNSPNFDWHLTNLQNYINLSPYATSSITLNGIVYSGTGQGSGLVGLPGDPTPPSRFIKMAMYQQAAMPTADATEALNLSEHILNNVDIPYGVVRTVKSVSMAPDNMDKTQWTLYKDLTHNMLYFRSYTNSTIQSIDMSKIDFSKDAKQFTMPLAQKAMIKDATAEFIRMQ
jgi:choloylglycine hydrolase